MADILTVLEVLAKEIPTFFMNPFLYAFILVAWAHYNRQFTFERKLYHRRLNHPGQQLLQTIGKGIGGGILVSILSLGLGLSLQPFDMWVIWGISFLLSLLQIQFLSFAYAGGFYVLLATLAQQWPAGAELLFMEGIWHSLSNAHIPSILGFLAVLHLIEAFLIGRNQGRGSSPLFLNGKRGMLVGAYQMQKFWLLPVITFMPVASGFSMPSWWPLLFAGTTAGLSFMIFPAVVGYTQLSITSLPQEKAKKSAKSLFYYSLILFGLALAAPFSAWIGIAAAVFAIIGHEGIIRFSQWKEWKEPPIFVQLGQGVVVFAVIPNTPAEKMGIETGDIILKVNGVEISKSEELYPALQVNSAFCKMEVRNVEGHMKYLQRAVYQGEHHQMGLILAPDKHTPYYVDMKPVSILHLLKQQIDKGA